MGEIRRLKIGNVTLENNLILAPMAGVTDLPFRLLCKEQGAPASLWKLEAVMPRPTATGN